MTAAGTRTSRKEVYLFVKNKYGIPLVLALVLILAALLFPARLRTFLAVLRSM
jgi:hypothetical protein